MSKVHYLYCLIIFNLLVANAHAEKFHSPNKKLEIQEVCHSKASCSYFSIFNKNRKLIVNDIDSNRVSISWLGNIAQLRISFGTYDDYSLFIDGYHSPHIIDSVFALDQRYQCVASVGDKGIYFYKLFKQRKPVKVISSSDSHYQFEQVASLLAIVEGKFDKDKFVLNYRDIKDNNVIKVFNNPCKYLGKN